MKEAKAATRADYHECMQRLADRFLEDPERTRQWCTRMDWRGPNCLLGILAYLARETGREDYAAAARGLFPRSGTLGSFCLYPTVRAYQALKETGVFDRPEQQAIKQYLTAEAQALVDAEYFRHFIGYRIFNHVLMATVGLDYLGRTILEGRIPTEWYSRIEAVREDCRRLGCPLENASNYEPLSWHVLFFWETFREDRYLAGDSRVRDMFDRNLQLLSPVGAMADYGDTSWNNGWGLWIAAFESAASLFKDGRFRHAAGSIFAAQWLNRSAWLDGPDLPAWTQVYDAYRLLYALDYLDETLRPEVLRTGSCLAYRQLPPFYQETLTPIECAPSVHDSGLGERRQDKLILRSGWDVNDTFLAIELQQRLWHDHFGAPAVITHTVGESVVLSDSGYWQDLPEFHNTFFIQLAAHDRPFASGMLPQERHGQSRAAALSREFGKPSVMSLDDFQTASFAAIETVSHMAYPCRHRRDLIFDKASGSLFVWDRLRVWEGEFEVGPLWHTQEILGECANGFVGRILTLLDHKGNVFQNNPRPFVAALWGEGGRLGRIKQTSYTGSESEPDPCFGNAWCLFMSRRAAAPEECGFLSGIVPLDSAGNLPLLEGRADGEIAVARVGSMTVGFSDGKELCADPVKTDAFMWLGLHESDRVSITFKKAHSLQLGGKPLLQVGAKQLDNALYEESRLSGEIVIADRFMTVILYSLIELEATVYPPRAAAGLSVDGEPLRRNARGPDAGVVLKVAGKLNLRLEF